MVKNLGHTYHPSTLTRMKAKGNKWYVFVTKPKELATRAKDQVRRSTGTTDENAAKRMQHKITCEIYAEFDKALNRDPFVELVEPYWNIDKHGQVSDFLKKWGRVEVCMRVWMASEGNRELCESLFRHLQYQEAMEFRAAITPKPDPYPVVIQQEKINDLRQFMEELDGEKLVADTLSKKPEKILNTSGCPTILGCLNEYMTSRKWKSIREKTRRYTPSYIEKCVGIIGDLPIDQLLPVHAVKIAQELENRGLANATIKNYKSALDGLIVFAKNNLNNETVTPVRPWIVANPLADVSISNYGAKKRSWEALTEDQLHHLFSLLMLGKDRLLLTILVTTGMRLDEAALLQWDQVKKDKNGITYFDLSMGALVKNDKFSARLVALPDCLSLPNKATGKLFNFKLDDDGKSAKDASRYLNEKYLHRVRFDKNDDRKVVHSLRHNFSGLLQNLVPTPSAEHLDWITGHDMEGAKTASERKRTYNQDIDLSIKYEIVNRVKHPWLN